MVNLRMVMRRITLRSSLGHLGSFRGKMIDIIAYLKKGRNSARLLAEFSNAAKTQYLKRLETNRRKVELRERELGESKKAIGDRPTVCINLESTLDTRYRNLDTSMQYTKDSGLCAS